MTCYMACVKPVTVQVEWGLREFDGKPRQRPMNKAFMCQDCYSNLKGACTKSIKEGKMHWRKEDMK